jgi:hypothetical protein
MQVLEVRSTKRNVSLIVATPNADRQGDSISAITGVSGRTFCQAPAKDGQGLNTVGGNAGSQFGRCQIGAIMSGSHHKTTRIITHIQMDPKIQDKIYLQASLN